MTNKYKDLKPYECYGSDYSIIPDKLEYLSSIEQRNLEEVYVNWLKKLKVIHCGTVIPIGDLNEASSEGSMSRILHPDLQ